MPADLPKPHVSFYLEKVRAFNEGDENALTEVLTKIAPLVKFQIVTRFPGLESTSAAYADLEQRARIRIWTCAQKFNPERNRNFLTYTMQAVRNDFNDYARAEQKEMHASLDDALFVEDRTFEERFHALIDMASVWGWVGESDSENTIRELDAIIGKRLTGLSLVLYILRKMSTPEIVIRRKLNLTEKAFRRAMNLLELRMRLIIDEFNAGLV